MRKAIISISVALATSSFATDLYTVSLTSNGQTGSWGYNNITDFINSIGSTTSIQQYVPAYTETSAANLNGNFRGLPINLVYGQNSTTLTLSVPSIGLNQSFTGATRKDSQDQLSDWFKTSGSSSVEALMRETAKVSPIDPIAGNPNSIVSQNIASTFSNGFNNVFNSIEEVGIGTDIPANAEVVRSNQMTIGASYLALNSGAYNTQRYSIPLGYSFVSSANPAKRINIMLPIGLSDTQGAKGFDLGLGISANYPLLKNWIITPALIYGSTGSIEIGAFGQVWTGGLTSALKFNVPGGALGIGNMIGYSSTTKMLYSGQYSYDPGIKNTVYKNGLIYDVDTHGLVNSTSLELFATNTAFTGTPLYLNVYNEYGFSFGFSKLKSVVVEPVSDDASLSQKAKTIVRQKLTQLRLGVTYLDGGSKSDGFSINFGYKF